MGDEELLVKGFEVGFAGCVALRLTEFPAGSELCREVKIWLDIKLHWLEQRRYTSWQLMSLGYTACLETLKTGPP